MVDIENMDINERIRKEGIRRCYSYRTIQAYQDHVRKFLEDCGKPLKEISKKDIREYLEEMAERGKAGSTLNIHLNALKFFFWACLGKRINVNLKYSKIPNKLPVVLSKEEIVRLLDAIKNEKHKFMISFMYSTGARLSELVNIRVRDLELGRGFGWIRQGKGNKDRMFIISEKLKFGLGKLSENKKPEEYLFQTNKNKKYDINSIYMIIKNASKISWISKYKSVHPHTLRHSFATHLIENGYSISDVQHLLGHASPETTTVYIHTASNSMINIKSPLDNL
jgi:site-specific recombinase XerD